jgi:hypothetical protein
VSDVWFEGGFEVEGRYIRRLIVLGVEVWDEQKECCGAACRLSDLRGKEDDSACLIDVEAEGGENWRGCGCVRKEVSVVHRLRFGGDSQIRTLQVVWTSWKGSAGQGPAISYETGTRPKGFSHVYKCQLATQVEQIDNKQCFHNHFMYTCLLRATHRSEPTGEPQHQAVQSPVHCRSLGCGFSSLRPFKGPLYGDNLTEECPRVKQLLLRNFFISFTE